MQESIQFENPTYEMPHYPQLSAPAVAVGLFFALFWPPVIGLAMGIAGWLWYSDTLYIKGGVVLGILGGCVLSLTFLLGSIFYRRFTASSPAAAKPNQHTVTYAPLGSVPGEDMHIVPLRTYDKLLDKVPVRDIA